MATAKDLRLQRAKLIEDARALATKEGATAEDGVNADRMLDEAETIMASVTRMERADAAYTALGNTQSPREEARLEALTPFSAAREREIMVRLRGSADGRVPFGSVRQLPQADLDYAVASLARERRVLVAMGLGATGSLAPEDQAHYGARYGAIQAAGNTQSQGGGGYTVAPLFEREILIAQIAQGGMRSVARVVQTDTGANLPWPTMDDTAQKAVIIGTENTDVGTGTDLSFGQKNLGANTYSTQVIPISVILLQDSAFDFDGLFRDAIAGRFTRGENAHYTTGTGVNQPQGVVTGAALGRTGTTGQPTSVIWDDLIELEHSVDPVYRAGARFMFHDSTLKALKKIKDSYGRYLWVPGTTVGAPDSIGVYPYTVNQDMAVMAASAKSIMFGNFNSYFVRDVLGMQIQVLRERYAEKMQVAYLAFKRADGRLISAASPLKFYANPAS